MHRRSSGGGARCSTGTTRADDGGRGVGARHVRRPLYVRHDEYHQAFDFDLMHARWEAAGLRARSSTTSVDGRAGGRAPTPRGCCRTTMSMRHATRYGLADRARLAHLARSRARTTCSTPPAAERRARAAALITLALPGSAYVYQGDELGLPDVWDLPARRARRPDVGAVGGHREGPRRLPRAAPVAPKTARRTASPTVDSWLPQPDALRQRSRPRRAGRRSGVDAFAVSPGAGVAARAAGATTRSSSGSTSASALTCSRSNAGAACAAS